MSPGSARMGRDAPLSGGSMADDTTTALHPLRQRMIEDMTLRGLSPISQKLYLRAVRSCCAHLRRRPTDPGRAHRERQLENCKPA